MTLSEFIENHHKLISSIGIFTALTLFSHNIAPISISRLLSTSFMALVLILSFELIALFRDIALTWRALAFVYVFLACVYLLLLYWLISFQEISRQLFVLIFVGVFFAIFKRIRILIDGFKQSGVHKINSSVGNRGYIMRFLAFFLRASLGLAAIALYIFLFVAGFMLTIYAADFINEFLRTQLDHFEFLLSPFGK